MAVADAFRRFLGGGPSEVPQDRVEFIRECADMGRDRLAGYRLYQNHYDGELRPLLTDRQRLYLEANGVCFTENVCATVVDKLAGRLHVESFQVAENPDASSWLSNTVWSYNGGDELQTIVHTNTPMLGDAFVIPSWDDRAGLPTYRYNRPGLIKMVYDEEGEARYAVKKWSTSRKAPQNPKGALILRLNIFYPDRVEKWFSADKDGELWAPWSDPEDLDVWPVPSTISGVLPTDGVADDPIGILPVHFRHKPLGRSYGRSELKAAIPFQNEHTKNVLDQFAVMDAQGWAWPWITGLKEGENVTLAVGDILKLTDPNAKVGQLPAADPTKTLPTIKGTLQRLSAFTDTPLFDLIIEGTPPTGEALKTAEGGLTKKAYGCHPGYGNSWVALCRRALRLAAAHGDLDFEFDPEAEITVAWDSPETRDELGEAQTAGFYADLGVSNQTLMRRLGFDPEEEAKLKAAEVARDALPPPA